MDLIYDVETTGRANFSRTWADPSQPYVVQVAAILADGIHEVHQLNAIIHHPNVEVPDEAAQVHGITTEVAKADGREALEVVKEFDWLARQAHQQVAHNLDYDWLCMKAAYARVGGTGGILDRLPRVCTMYSAKDVLKLPGKYRDYKFPGLAEAYRGLVDPNGFEGAHDAMADVRACHAVLNALRDEGHELKHQQRKAAPTVTDAQYREVLDILELADEAEDLSTWEEGFVKDFQAKAERYGQDLLVSEKQMGILRRIRAKLEGETTR